jgi:carboxypeptidase PM20D1
VLALLLVLGVRTLRLHSYQEPVAPAEIDGSIDSLAVAHLALAVRCATVSGTDRAVVQPPFESFQNFLSETYPRVFARLTRIPVPALDDSLRASLAMCLKWPGTNPSLSPVLLLAHQDVVPVEPGTESAWEVPPFEGRMAGGYLWGRGSMDDKGSLITILEAVESLLASGFQPERTVYLGFGNDEEIGGEGARAIAHALLADKVRLAFVLDEGMAVTEGYMPGFKNPVALIGIAEKGSALVELTASAEGGHVSMPPRPTASGLLVQALTALELHPMPPALRGPTRRMLEFLGPETRFPLRVVFANLWLFSPIIEASLARKPATDATLRTTAAVIRMESGVKENVVPSRAQAVVSFRIRPGDSVAGVLQHVRSLVDTTRVAVRLLPDAREPSPVSDPESTSFRVVARAIRSVFPNAVVAPALVLGGTDSRHFAGIADAVYRFVPLRFRPGDSERIHGTNERVSVDNVTEMVRFYKALLETASRPF